MVTRKEREKNLNKVMGKDKPEEPDTDGLELIDNTIKQIQDGDDNMTGITKEELEIELRKLRSLFKGDIEDQIKAIPKPTVNEPLDNTEQLNELQEQLGILNNRFGSIGQAIVDLQNNLPAEFDMKAFKEEVTSCTIDGTCTRLQEMLTPVESETPETTPETLTVDDPAYVCTVCGHALIVNGNKGICSNCNMIFKIE